jgi:magnesium chelatase family protein
MLRSRCVLPTASPGGASLPPSPEPANSAVAGTAPLETVPADTAPATPLDALPDLADVRGQYFAKRALELAAAGGHNVLMIGPPGTGKTLLAQCLPGLLPALSHDAALEVACLVSAAGGRPPLGARRPFRSPQHTASLSALIGSAAFRPGEIALAHHGVLFLDELPEFPRDVLEALREPLESGTVMLARAKRTVVFPASFQLVAAMNPCPCGHAGAASGRCRCTRTQVLRYRGRISGPLLDRIDLHVELSPVPAGHLVTETPAPGEPSAAVAQRVAEAQRVQLERQGMLNARLASRALQERCRLDRSGLALARRAIERLGLSARAYHRVLKIARTIADLAGEPGIRAVDLSEAIGLRALDRDGKRDSGERAGIGRESTQRSGVQRDSEQRGGVERGGLSRPD